MNPEDRVAVLRWIARAVDEGEEISAYVIAEQFCLTMRTAEGLLGDDWGQYRRDDEVLEEPEPAPAQATRADDMVAAWRQLQGDQGTLYVCAGCKQQLATGGALRQHHFACGAWRSLTGAILVRTCDRCGARTIPAVSFAAHRRECRPPRPERILPPQPPVVIQADPVVIQAPAPIIQADPPPLVCESCGRKFVGVQGFAGYVIACRKAQRDTYSAPKDAPTICPLPGCETPAGFQVDEFGDYVQWCPIHGTQYGRRAPEDDDVVEATRYRRGRPRKLQVTEVTE